MASKHFKSEPNLTPVSIYFDIGGSGRADLEEISRAAIAWSTALKGVLAKVEPGVQLRVELVDGDKGSLWLNTLLDLVESQLEQIARGADAYPRLKALAKGLAIIVVATPLNIVAEDVWRAVAFDEPEVRELSPEAQDQIKSIFEDVLEKRLGEKQRDDFADTAAKITNLRAVGISSSPQTKPRIRVSKAQLERYVRREKIEVETTRSNVVQKDVLLVSPVLEEAERSWKFREPGMPEFGAVMRDKAFLSALSQRAVHEELRFGIPMRIDLEIKEKLEGEFWMPLERSVVRVIEPKIDRAELPF